MLRCHVRANELVDIALTGDRDAYRTKLAQVEREFGAIGYDNIKRQAAMQYRMETRDHRFTGWRAEWINANRKEA